MQTWVENLLRQKIVALDSEQRRPYEWAGDVYRALAFGELFWPDVHLVRGMAFLAIGDNTSFADVEEAIEGAARSGSDEDLWNEVSARSFFEVPDFFAEAEDPLDPDLPVAYDELARVLVRCWTGRLAQVLPASAFEVSVAQGTETAGVGVFITQALEREARGRASS